jgi:hypothetical protein
MGSDPPGLDLLTQGLDLRRRGRDSVHGVEILSQGLELVLVSQGLELVSQCLLVGGSLT